MGKLVSEARAEVALSADILAYFAANTEDFLKKVTIHENGTASEVISEPLGIIFAVEPWNYPTYQVARVAGPQLMAGNVLLVKHASTVPQCALAFAKLFEDAGAPTGLYENVFPSRPQTNLIIDDFRVHGITLTGSDKAGAVVAERAGRKLKKVVLELGGSDPFIVLADADLDGAIMQACGGRMLCMGQVCASPKRFIIVGKERSQRFLGGLKQRLGSLRAGDPMDAETSIAPLSSESALKTLLEQIDKAKKSGATVNLGGKRLDRPGFYLEPYLEPTIITGISRDNPVFCEELFGPIAMVFTVDAEDEAVSLANATEFGLGSTIVTKNEPHGRDLADKIDAGMVFINSCALTISELLFGGVKNSGFGRELSGLGMAEFVNKKLVRVAPK